ncbi:transposase family protein [Lipingzhangella sp. LS1_29]|uniref:Transposase family protein n=1 Tax=Lipingzhangella rawalii TaxID=2055835 RepID=A0ABU2H163_9ACTN|nr:transposase family protein [Lipingzhangella rawalii]MDS1269050.1 transposase family protein [Lipingzhangella rawalii]
MDPADFPPFLSDAEPGSTHDLTAARTHVLGALYAAVRDLPTLADLGHHRADIGILIPTPHPASDRPLDPDTRTANRLHRGLRCLGERGVALLTQRWRLLQHVHASPSTIGTIAKAALVRTHVEHQRLT